ncbi:MAG: acyltransferase [Candidatus Aenigmatarchaeota archaeon]
MSVFIHPSADVDKTAKVGDGTKVWNNAQIREGARVGENCMIGSFAYVCRDVKVGSNVKVQGRASLYHGTTVEDGVFIGPHACLTNDKTPRAVTSEGKPKRESDWKEGKILVREGASIGAGAIIMPGTTIGRWAMVGAGSVVTRDVPANALVYGSPAKQVGWVCTCGQKAEVKSRTPLVLRCGECNKEVRV